MLLLYQFEDYYADMLSNFEIYTGFYIDFLLSITDAIM